MLSALEYESELEDLCRTFGVRRLELFGSAATDRSTPQSDLDFLVEFTATPPGGFADAYFGLMEGLQSLFGRPVDLVMDSAITNPHFRRSVDQTKNVLYAA